MKTGIVKTSEVVANKSGNFSLITCNFLALFIVVISCIFFQSCGNSIKDKGKVTIKNGKNEDVSILYECTNCETYTIDKQIFITIINEITNSTKNNLKYPLSFVPSNIILKIYNEDNLKYYDTKSSVGKAISVSSTMYYTAKNGFGNELEGKNEDFFYIKNGSVDRELPKKIKLTSLELKEGSYGSTYINRELLVSNEIYEFIQISPDIKHNKEGIYLIVKSSTEEIGRIYTTLTFSFLYGEKSYDNNLVIESSDDTNEDKSISYYNLTKEQIEILKNNKLASVRIKRFSNSIYCPVDENLRTYFKEYFSLKEVEQIIQKVK
jgi:hypothetical protein